MAPLLVLDVHYLCHRAFHAQGNLTWNGDPTGVIFGFLKSISGFKDEFNTERIAFCFEGEKLHRKAIYQPYKANRGQGRVKTPVDQRAYSSLKIQIEELRRTYLPQIGFKNVFRFKGYESDDVMAALAAKADRENEVVLVTADSDMYQCLSPFVSIYHPQKQVTFDADWFRGIYGIRPSKWAVVKAISGCKSDNVQGVGGVGEITALRFLRKELPRNSAAFGRITSKAGKAIVRLNRKLVQLPYDGCPVPTIQEDQITTKAWWSVCNALGLRSIAGQPPILTSRLGMFFGRERMKRFGDKIKRFPQDED